MSAIPIPGPDGSGSQPKTPQTTRTIVHYTFEVDGRPVLLLPVQYDGTLTALPADRVQLRAVKAAWQELVDAYSPDETAAWLPADAAQALWHAWEEPYEKRVSIRRARFAEMEDWDTCRAGVGEHLATLPPDERDKWDADMFIAWLKGRWREAGEPALYEALIDGRLIYVTAIPSARGPILVRDVLRWPDGAVDDVLHLLFTKTGKHFLRKKGEYDLVRAWPIARHRVSFRRVDPDDR
jgi:hypothetical protein